jgi:hypothetical protein
LCEQCVQDRVAELTRQEPWSYHLASTNAMDVIYRLQVRLGNSATKRS